MAPAPFLKLWIIVLIAAALTVVAGSFLARTGAEINVIVPVVLLAAALAVLILRRR